MQRYLAQQIKNDLNRKMVFLAGPRQVGKTTLSKQLVKNYDYLNWDTDAGRTRILKQEFKKAELIIFDEIHKYKTWRNYLKGIYDSWKQASGLSQKILVTGSAKLDILRKGGDSLQGRYHFLRMHPISIDELKQSSQNDFFQLFQLGGFPEPFLEGSKTQAKRWSREYLQKLVRQEVSSQQQIIDLGNLELMLMRLPALVGSPLSINAVREDLQVAHKTVTHWLNILEKLYCIFRLAPFGSPFIQAVKKEQKMYFYDWNCIKDDGHRFENMVACHLLKFCHFVQDTEGSDLDLRYCREISGKEIDFVLIQDEKPVCFIECKLSDSEIQPAFKSLAAKFSQIPKYQIYLKGQKDYLTPQQIRVMSGFKFLTEELPQLLGRVAKT
jgi:predicted AAA+ superfamily ATPase